MAYRVTRSTHHHTVPSGVLTSSSVVVMSSSSDSIGVPPPAKLKSCALTMGAGSRVGPMWMAVTVAALTRCRWGPPHAVPVKSPQVARRAIGSNRSTTSPMRTSGWMTWQ